MSSSSSDSSDSSDSSSEKIVQQNKKEVKKSSSSSDSSSDDSSSSDEVEQKIETPNNNLNKRKNEENQTPEKNNNNNNNKKQKGESGSMIKIFNLSFKTTDDSLYEGFKECGTITRANVAMRDGMSRGFAFIEFEEEEAANKAMEYNNTNFEGREIRIEIADKNEGNNRRGGGEGGASRSTHLVGNTTRVIVKNCVDITQDQLSEAFAKFGEIKEVFMLNDKPVSFITFYDLRHAENAFNQASLQVGNVTVNIDLIEPRVSRGGGGGGDKGGFGGNKGGFGGGNRGGGDRGGFGGNKGGFGGGNRGGGDRGGFGGNKGGFGGGNRGGGFGGNKGGFGGGNKGGFGGNKGGFGGNKGGFGGGGNNKKITFDK